MNYWQMQLDQRILTIGFIRAIRRTDWKIQARNLNVLMKQFNWNRG